MSRRNFLFCAAAIALLAFGVREWYVLAVLTPHPFAGDSFQYMRYAYNLVHSGVYSHGQGVIVPDDFRTPGYPLLLAALMPFSHEDAARFVVLVRQAQVVIGTLTVAGSIALARQWLPRGWALLAGLLIALWPHHVVATSSLLTEVLFGAALAGALLCASVALARGSMRWGITAGAVFGLAYLVNPVIALFPVVALPVFWRRGLARVGAAMLAVSLVAVVGWAIRNVDVPHTPGRAAINFVQGSWPDYHWDYRGRQLWRAAEFQAIVDDVNRVVDTPAIGWPIVGHRLASDPARYVRWYALEKPWLLWDRSIQLGQGGIYFLQTERSPFETSPVLRAVQAVYMAANPFLTALLAGMTLLLLFRRDHPSALLCALLVLYLTAIHVVFQAEPRYAIAYRPLEAIIVAAAVLELRRWIARIAQSQDARQTPTAALPAARRSLDSKFHRE
jgi:hypothetical protein